MADTTPIATTALGAEYDQQALETIRQALRRMGARRKGRLWGLGGSQVLDQYTFIVRGRELQIDVETYVGISATGPSETVEELKRLVSQAGGADREG